MNCGRGYEVPTRLWKIGIVLCNMAIVRRRLAVVIEEARRTMQAMANILGIDLVVENGDSLHMIVRVLGKLGCDTNQIERSSICGKKIIMKRHRSEKVQEVA